MLALILFSFVSLATGCFYKEERKAHGETWIVGTSFVMNCTINSDGSWFTAVSGCRTQDGRIVEPGMKVKENGQFYFECVGHPGGRTEIKRTYDIESLCGNHKIGESWISNRNFNKTCFADGSVQIQNCITDLGVSFALNSTITIGKVKYICKEYANGHVVIDRKPADHAFSSNIASGPAPPTSQLVAPAGQTNEVTGDIVSAGPPSAVPPPDFDDSMFDEPSQPKKTASHHGNTVESSDAIVVKAVPPKTIVAPRWAAHSLTCDGDGVVRQPEETWISNNKFTKKCTPAGATIILNCIINKDVTINIDSTVKIGRKVYTCTRKAGTVYYEEKFV